MLSMLRHRARSAASARTLRPHLPMLLCLNHMFDTSEHRLLWSSSTMSVQCADETSLDLRRMQLPLQPPQTTKKPFGRFLQEIWLRDLEVRAPRCYKGLPCSSQSFLFGFVDTDEARAYTIHSNTRRARLPVRLMFGAWFVSCFARSLRSPFYMKALRSDWRDTDYQRGSWSLPQGFAANPVFI